MSNRVIHVIIVEEDNPECFSIGVIDNITINDKESFMPRLMEALDEHFDADTLIVSDFVYEDLFRHNPVTLTVSVSDDVGTTSDGFYKITIAETWMY
jgi:hypothetical protein